MCALGSVVIIIFPKIITTFARATVTVRRLQADPKHPQNQQIGFLGFDKAVSLLDVLEFD